MDKKIKQLVLLSISLFVLSIAIDGFSTYMLFKKDYEGTMATEINLEVRKLVQEQGIFWGSFSLSFNQFFSYSIAIALGVLVFLFIDLKIYFKEEFEYDVVVLYVCISTIILASLKIGAGLSNLLNLLEILFL